MTVAFVAGRQRVDDATGILELLTINHPSFLVPVRLVNDTRDWVSQGKTFVGFPFRFTYPQDSDSERPQSKLEIDNVGRDLMGELEALPPSAVLSGTVQLVDRATPDVIEWSWTVPITSMRADAITLTGTLSVDYLMRQQAVRLRHDPKTSPGIF